MSLAILVPVLGRPHRVRPLLDAIAATTPRPYRALFLTDRDDVEEKAAIDAAGGERVDVEGGYAEKITAGVHATTEPLLFLGADDLSPRPGWLEAAAAKLTGDTEVVGVNDLIERRPERANHATHFLMTRRYALEPCADGSPGPLWRGYSHSFCDDELLATATSRGVYAYAQDSHVEHHHPMAGTAPDDETYRLGRAQFRIDRKHFLGRRHLWT